RVVEAAVAHRKSPSPVPLSGPLFGEALQSCLIGDLESVALDHYVQPVIPLAAACRQYHVRVVLEVDGFLLVRPGTEVQRAVKPHRHRGRNVRSAVSANRAYPEDLGRLDCAARVLPSDRS